MTISSNVINRKLSGLTQQSNNDNRWEWYRKKIQQEFNIDINDYSPNYPIFKDGRAAIKHAKITDFPLDQIIKGIRIETEHGSDLFVALEISLDHLSEDSSYYDALEKMESSFKRY